MERMADDPVLLLEGPRSVGKSTLLHEIAALRGARILDLDDLATRDAVAADPGTMIAGDQPVCIDEYQKAPVVLDAIKATGVEPTRSEVAMLPKNYVTLEGNAIRQMMKLMEAHDDSEDTRNVWTNADFDEKDIEASLT